MVNKGNPFPQEYELLYLLSDIRDILSSLVLPLPFPLLFGVQSFGHNVACIYPVNICLVAMWAGAKFFIDAGSRLSPKLISCHIPGGFKSFAAFVASDFASCFYVHPVLRSRRGGGVVGYRYIYIIYYNWTFVKLIPIKSVMAERLTAFDKKKRRGIFAPLRT